MAFTRCSATTSWWKTLVIGASDAGIYVGQSSNIIVRRNRVEYNVAGIEIENSQYADVYENVATHNTGGILAFKLPDLPVKAGKYTRIFNNHIVSNDTENFGAPGAMVSKVPKGTGVVVLATRHIEVFKNIVRDNATASVQIISYFPYLDVNCAHCHNPEGPANTTGLYLGSAVTESLRRGSCKVPVSGGQGSGSLLFDIVPGKPDESILVHRMKSTTPKVMMPELGRTLAHEEGVALVREWVASLQGECTSRTPGGSPQSDRAKATGSRAADGR